MFVYFRLPVNLDPDVEGSGLLPDFFELMAYNFARKSLETDPTQTGNLH